MVGTLSVAGRKQASYLGGPGSRVRSSVQMARDLVRDNGVREALSVSGSYVSGLWARLNGLRASAATERLPLGMATPLSDAGAPIPLTTHVCTRMLVCLCMVRQAQPPPDHDGAVEYISYSLAGKLCHCGCVSSYIR